MREFISKTAVAYVRSLERQSTPGNKVRIRVGWTDDTLVPAHPMYHQKSSVWSEAETGWYLSATYDVNADKIIVMTFSGGGFEVSNEESPYIKSLGKVSEVVDGMVEDGSFAEQIVFESMFKRLPQLRDIPFGGLRRSTVSR